MNHRDEVAKRKANVEGLDALAWEVIGSDAVMVTMGYPRIKTKGKNKGKKTWDGSFKEVVTKQEEFDEMRRYESETGLCAPCFGDGKVFGGWHYIDGIKHKQCPKCKGMGKANPPSEAV